MVTTILEVEGMTCDHCVKAVTDAVMALSGVSNVIVELESKRVTVDHDPKEATLDKIKAEIAEEGYTVV